MKNAPANRKLTTAVLAKHIFSRYQPQAREVPDPFRHRGMAELVMRLVAQSTAVCVMSIGYRLHLITAKTMTKRLALLGLDTLQALRLYNGAACAISDGTEKQISGYGG